jgi:hypothetical protein
VHAVWSGRRAPSTVAVGDEPPMNSHEARVLWASKDLDAPVPRAPDSYKAWSAGNHDDLVLSVALACWAGERYLRCRMRVTARPKGL